MHIFSVGFFSAKLASASTRYTDYNIRIFTIYSVKVDVHKQELWSQFQVLDGRYISRPVSKVTCFFFKQEWIIAGMWRHETVMATCRNN